MIATRTITHMLSLILRSPRYIKSSPVFIQVLCIIVIVVLMALMLSWNYSNLKLNEYQWTATETTNTNANTTKIMFTNRDIYFESKYHVLHDACIEWNGLHQWTIRSSKVYRNKAIKLRTLIGGNEYVHEHFRIVKDKTLLNRAGNTNNSNIRIQMGTYMICRNTYANNFHIINDILLPVFRVYRQIVDLRSLMVPRGCVDCWKGRLPIQDLGLEMMNLSVLYPMEDFVSNITALMCFERIVIQRHQEMPYYRRNARFSKFYSQELFADFRDAMKDYIQTLLPLRDDLEYNTSISSIPKTNESSGVRNKPVLSWMSRASDICYGRCISNKEDAIASLSKYFHVNLLDFSKGLTTLQALAYIQQTDVLIGMHGAGLAYTAFLPDQAILVEIRGNYSNRMFINMASSLNIPYYALSLYGCIDPGTNDVYTLPSDAISTLTEEIYGAYLHEKQKLAEGDLRISDGKCEFPQPVEPCGHLSATNKSRCYLHKRWDWRTLHRSWFQCTWHKNCKRSPL